MAKGDERMAIQRSVDRPAFSPAEAQLARVAGEGSARHAHLSTLVENSGPHIGRDLADAVHLFCSLHGRHPGLVEMALTGCGEGPARSWLNDAAESFERERLFLVRLTSAVGPMPSTPGAAETEASLVAQRSAIEVLARSERRGCALGAATALISDWRALRGLFNRASARVGLDLPPCTLPEDSSIAAVIAEASDTLASERALAFGGEQLLLQHRALLDLLEARASARGDW